MKISEWRKINNIHNDEDERNFFRNNLLSGKSPVAIYSCNICGEIINPVFGCLECNKEGENSGNIEQSVGRKIST